MSNTKQQLDLEWFHHYVSSHIRREQEEFRAKATILFGYAAWGEFMSTIVEPLLGQEVQLESIYFRGVNCRPSVNLDGDALVSMPDHLFTQEVL
jgi:hypothetical protein